MPQFQMLEANPSFSSQLGSALGGGVGQGISGMLNQYFENKQKMAQTQQLLSALGLDSQQSTGSTTPGMSSKEAPNMAAKRPGLDLSPERVIAASVLGDKMGLPHLGTTAAGIYQGQQKQEAQQKKETFSREQAAEPKLLELNDKLTSYEQEGMRFDRLQELFSPELEDKFPSSISFGLLTKDGELRPTAAAALSTEAQEAVKLIADNLNGAKDTFGARVTNFDVQSYMKRLPTLLNTAEGRRAVLRDLRLMNKLNTMHAQGILDTVDKYGGPGKISISKAESIFRKQNTSKINQIRSEFVNPEKTSFSSFPDAKVYSGRLGIDEETGQKFRSNGKEWVPENK